MTRARRRALSLIAAAVVAVAVGLILDAVDALPGVERASVSARFAVRGEQAPPPGVVLVAVDDRSFPRGAAPFSRQHYVDLLNVLADAEASVIAFDVPFTEPSEDPDADDALIDAVRNTPNVVLGTDEVAPNGTTAIFGGPEALEYSGATPANTSLPADDDGRIRQMQAKLKNLETFAMAAVRIHRDGKVAPPPGGKAWIDFPGGAGAIRTVSLADVEAGKVDPNVFKDRIVVVGVTAERQKDFEATPTTDKLSGPEIQAAAIATALAGFPLQDAGWLAGVLAILLLGAMGPLVAWRFGHVAGVVATAVALVGFLIAAQIAFANGTILKVVPALGAAVVGAIGAVAASNPDRSPVDALIDRLTRGVAGNQRTRRLRAMLLISAALFVIVGTLVLEGTRVLNRIELSTVDTRFNIRGTQPAPDDVIVVGIDDKTFAEPPKPRSPFDRVDHAKVIRHLSEAGAKVIAYDIQFSEPDVARPKGDIALLEAAAEAGNVVFATTEIDEHGIPNAFYYEIPGFELSRSENLAYAGGHAGNSNYSTDSDNRIRRTFFRTQDLESFPIASARLEQGGGIDLPPGDWAWIDYAGPPKSVKYLSFVDVRRGTFRPEDVRGKVVVVGATAPSEQDLHQTSTTSGGLMPGPEVHANAIHTALAGFPLKSAPDWLNWLLVIALGALTPFLALRRGILLPVAVGALAVAAVLVGAQLAFNSGTIITVVYPVLAGIVAILLTAAIHGLTVAFEREQARDAFARFVPEAVVDQVLADADGVRLGGVRGEATVMFSDLRGFTSFSETLEPERVIESLNRYLTEMSEAILDHGGTLVAYMGDGIMAVFGAPLKQDDHADRALEAAREMLDRMDGFNGWLREQGLHDGFKMGIGLNSGPVMSGNVGSERRLEYTALGDTTNTAARLEGMTKGTPHQLYIADTTKQLLTRAPDDLVAVGEAEVRGRKAKVLLWSLGDGPSPTATDASPSETVKA
jgi:adenylate cyclase